MSSTSPASFVSSSPASFVSSSPASSGVHPPSSSPSLGDRVQAADEMSAKSQHQRENTTKEDQDNEESEANAILFVTHGMGQLPNKFTEHIQAMQKAYQELVSQQHQHLASVPSSPPSSPQCPIDPIKSGDFSSPKPSSGKTSSPSPHPESKTSLPTPDFKMEIIPIEWHTALHTLESVDAEMRKVTLPTCPILRQINNGIIADVLYYFTSFHGQSIVNIVTRKLNTAFRDFLKRQHDIRQRKLVAGLISEAEARKPWAGSIAIFAHSLGGIITYDILAHQTPEYRQRRGSSATRQEGQSSPDLRRSSSPSRSRPGSQKPTHWEIIYPKLHFKPHFLFTLGSPVAAVMIMRGQTFEQYKPPEWLALHNIFHLYDPFGYRIEPLMHPDYIQVPPVVILPLQRTSYHFSTQINYYSSMISNYFREFASVPNLPSLPAYLSMSAVPPFGNFKLSWANFSAVSSSFAFLWSEKGEGAVSASGDEPFFQGKSKGDGTMSVEEQDAVAQLANLIQDSPPSPPPIHGREGDESQGGMETRLAKKRKRDGQGSETPSANVGTGAFRVVRQPHGHGHGRSTVLSPQPGALSKPSSLKKAKSSVLFKLDESEGEGQAGKKRKAPDGTPTPSSEPYMSPARSLSALPDLIKPAASRISGGVQSVTKMLSKIVEPVMSGMRSVSGRPGSSPLLGSISGASDANADNAAKVGSPSRPSSLPPFFFLPTQTQAPPPSTSTTNSPPPASSPASPIQPPPTRYDFCLQEDIVQNLLHQYVIGVRSHFSYWSSKELMAHVIRHLSQRYMSERLIGYVLSSDERVVEDGEKADDTHAG